MATSSTTPAIPAAATPPVSLSVSPASFLSRTLPGLGASYTSGLLCARWDPSHPSRVSHVLANRTSSLEVREVRWNEEEGEGEEEGGEQPADASMGEETTPASSAPRWSLHLAPLPQPPVIGQIQQMALLPALPSSLSSLDLLLLTSDSGFLSLLCFESNSGRGGTGRLRALAHTRLGAAGTGRRQMGTFLQVESEGRAIAVASREGRKEGPPPGMMKEGKESETKELIPTGWVQGEGGVLIYPIGAPTDTTSGASASSPSPSSSHSLPNLQPPIPLPIDGVITSILFLPRLPSAPPSSLRLLVSFVPAVHPNPLAAAGIGVHAPPPRSTHISLFHLDLSQGTFKEKPYPLQLERNELVLDMMVIPNKGQGNKATASAASSSSSSSSKSASADPPCFVLLQLETRLLLLDINSRSTLLFPVSLPVPGWSDVFDQSLQRCVGRVPLLTAWSWVRGDRLVCVSETGETFLLHFWFNNRHTNNSMPPQHANVEQWMRFVPLGLATPSACMTSLSSPASTADGPASSPSSPDDFLLLPGEASQGMLLRIDWTSVEQDIRASDPNTRPKRVSPDAMQVDEAASSSPDGFPSTFSSSSSSLHRHHHLSNLSPLWDFVSFNATLGTASPSKHQQIFMTSGMGRHGCLRVVRPGTVQAELITNTTPSPSPSSSPAVSPLPHPHVEDKIFQHLLPLRRRTASGSMESFALVCSFLGSTRVRALVDGVVEDVSERFAGPQSAAEGGEQGWMKLDGSTLDASLSLDGRMLIQVTEQSVRAICVRGAGTDEFAAEKLMAVWTPKQFTSGMSTPSHFTLAHVLDRFVFLSLPAARCVLLLQLRIDAASSSGHFEEVSRFPVESDVSCVQLGALRASSSSSAPLQPADLVCFIATHEGRLLIFKSNSPATPLALFHQLDMKSMLPVERESDMSCVVESILLCSTLDQPSSLSSSLSPSPASSPPSPPRFDLYLGVRDGHLVRLNFDPSASPSTIGVSATGILRQPVIERLGTAPVKLVRLDGGAETEQVVILALSEHTYLVQATLTNNKNDSRNGRLHARELVWPWNTPLSSRLQFAAPFSFSSSSASIGFGCVVGGAFHIAELDLSQSDSTPTVLCELAGTPRRILHHVPTNTLAILTQDHAASAGVQSQLLIVHPMTGQLLSSYTFGRWSKGGKRVPDEAAFSMCMWNIEDKKNKTFKEYIAVGTGTLPRSGATPAGGVYCFSLEPNTNDLSSSPSSSSPPMDLTDLSPTPSTAASSAPPSLPPSAHAKFIHTPSSSPYRLHLYLPYLNTDANASACVSLCCYPLGSTLLAAMGSQMHLLKLNLDPKSQKFGELHIIRAAHTFSYPILDMQVHVQPARYMLVVTEQQAGSSTWEIKFVKKAGHTRGTLEIICLQSDPLARVARQAILYKRRAELVPTASLLKAQVGHAFLLSRPSSSSPASVLPSSVELYGMVGFDLFGQVYLLRQEPSFDTPQSTAALNDSLKSHARAVAAAAAAKAASSSATPAPAPLPPLKLAEHAISKSLVQEASFYVGSTPSRVRAVERNTARTGAAASAFSSVSSTAVPAAPATPSRPLFLFSTLLGSLHSLRELSSSDAKWLRLLQRRLADSSLTRSLVSNHHSSYRSGPGYFAGPLLDEQLVIDGDMLHTFFTLTVEQQQQMCAGLPLEDNSAWRVGMRLQRLLQVEM